MDQLQTARGGRYFILGIAGICLIGAIALMLRSTLTSTQTYENQRAQLRSNRLFTLRADEGKKLNTYRWADKAKGIVQIPLERAMALTLADIKGKGAVASTMKAEPNQTNIVPPYLQAKPAVSAAAPVTATPSTTATTAVPATPVAPATGK